MLAIYVFMLVKDQDILKIPNLKKSIYTVNNLNQQKARNPKNQLNKIWGSNF